MYDSIYEICIPYQLDKMLDLASSLSKGFIGKLLLYSWQSEASIHNKPYIQSVPYL